MIVQPLSTKEASTNASTSDEEEDSADDDDMYDPADSDVGGGMPIDGLFADEHSASDLPPLTLEQLLTCTPLLRGYALKTKQWLNFFVNSVREIQFNDKAFESLVLPSNQKGIVARPISNVRAVLSMLTRRL